MLSAEDIARRLGGKRSGRQWKCRCPAHDDKEPSCIIYDGRTHVQFRCMAGCPSEAIVLALCDRGILGGRNAIGGERPPPIVRRETVPPHDSAKKLSSLALRIWNEAIDPRNTLAELYLCQRGLMLPPAIAGTVARFHPRCRREDEYVPALVVLMRHVETDQPQAIQRIFLTPRAKKYGKPMMLGPAGHCAMKLSSHAQTFTDVLSFCPVLHITEGFETAVSLFVRGCVPVWALGSSGAIERFDVLFGVGDLIIAADHDRIDPRTGERPGLAAAVRCRALWDAPNHSATIITPDVEGHDFADKEMLDDESKTT